MLGQYIEHLLA